MIHFVSLYFSLQTFDYDFRNTYLNQQLSTLASTQHSGVYERNKYSITVFLAKSMEPRHLWLLVSTLISLESTHSYIKDLMLCLNFYYRTDLRLIFLNE